MVIPVIVPVLLVNPESFVKSDTFVGIVGVPIKSEYVPVFATLCNLMVPLNDSLEEALCAVVLLVFNVPGADGIGAGQGEFPLVQQLQQLAAHAGGMHGRPDQTPGG